MGSGAIIYEYIPSFIKIGSGIQKLMGEGGFTDRDIQTHRYHGDRISVLWESRLNTRRTRSAIK
jgi:hypothetical protein